MLQPGANVAVAGAISLVSGSTRSGSRRWRRSALCCASCVLLFGYPASPLAQPRNIVLGNLIGGLVGVALVSTAGQGPVVLALAVGLTILLGQQLRCLHPPAGGMAFLAVYLKVAWGFLLFPVLSGSVLLVLLACVFSRWVPGASPYPQHWL
jgi:CBS-domain-containing membrane protein